MSNTLQAYRAGVKLAEVSFMNKVAKDGPFGFEMPALTTSSDFEQYPYAPPVAEEPVATPAESVPQRDYLGEYYNRGQEKGVLDESLYGRTMNQPGLFDGIRDYVSGLYDSASSGVSSAYNNIFGGFEDDPGAEAYAGEFEDDPGGGGFEDDPGGGGFEDDPGGGGFEDDPGAEAYAGEFEDDPGAGGQQAGMGGLPIFPPAQDLVARARAQVAAQPASASASASAPAPAPAPAATNYYRVQKGDTNYGRIAKNMGLGISGRQLAQAMGNRNLRVGDQIDRNELYPGQTGNVYRGGKQVTRSALPPRRPAPVAPSTRLPTVTGGTMGRIQANPTHPNMRGIQIPQMQQMKTKYDE